MRLPDSLSPLGDRRFAWFFGGRLISTMGSVMAPVALTFAVLDLTDSPSALGEVLAARSIPLVLFLLVGGVVADRFSRSLVMQISHLSSAATQGLVAVLLLTGTADLWMVIVLEALNGVASAFTFPAMQGVVPLVVHRTYIQQANALLGFTRNGLAVLGPTVAALLVVTVGSGWAIAVDAATWAVASFCMSRLKLEGAMKTKGPMTSMVRDLKDGWSAFTTHTWVWVVVVSFGVLNAIHAGALYTLGPVIAKETIGVAGWGYVLSAEAAGLLVMTLLMLKLRLHRPLRAGMLGVCLVGGPMIVLGLDPLLVALVPLAFLGGCGIEVFGIGWQTAMHEHIPNEVMSRVASYDALGSFVAIPIGQLVYGPLAQVFEASDVMLVSGILYVAISLGTLASSSVRNLERAPVSVEQTSSPEAVPHG
jgi:MFS family permease